MLLFMSNFRIVDNKFKHFNQSLVNIPDWKPDL